MKQFLTVVLSLLIMATIAVGQTKAQQQAQRRPEVQRLDAPELAEAQRQASEARTAAEAAAARAEAAAARAETAQQRVLTVLYRVMAEMKLSPKEWQVKPDQSGLYLERIKPAEAQASAPAQQPSAGPPKNP